jgi:hypothetical protein
LLWSASCYDRPSTTSRSITASRYGLTTYETA